MKDQFLLWAAAASAVWYFSCEIAEAGAKNSSAEARLKCGVAAPAGCKDYESLRREPFTGETSCQPDSCLCQPTAMPTEEEYGELTRGTASSVYWSVGHCNWLSFDDPSCPLGEYCSGKWIYCRGENELARPYRLKGKKDRLWLCANQVTLKHSEAELEPEEAATCAMKPESPAPETKVSDLGEYKKPEVEFDFSGKKHPKHESDVTGTK